MSALNAQASALPVLRPDVEFHPGPDDPDGSPTFIIHDPLRGTFEKATWVQAQILRLLRVPSTVDRLLERLAAGATTRELATPAAAPGEGTRESVSAYLTVRITEPDRSIDIFNELYQMEGVQSCEAVRGDVDIILLAQADSVEGIQDFFERVGALKGVEVASMSPVKRPKLDRDVDEFIEVYKNAVKQAAGETVRKQPGTTSYIIVDIDPESIQQIFTTVFFIDDVVFCDVIEEGGKLVGMITGQEAVGRTPRIIEKLGEIDGVLRVREAKIIKLVED